MVPRRNSTIPNPSSSSSRPTSGSFGGRRPLSLVTNQKTFRATTAQTVETESPQSENFEQDTPIAPPMPPRSSPFPELPPRNSLKRQSTRRNTHETFSSALDFPLQSQLPSVMHMPSPPPLQSPVHPPPTPTRPPQPAPGEGVGGFAVTFPPRRGSGRNYSHQYTADYTYRFDTMPSPRSSSGTPHYESADISGGIHANVWPTYNKISRDLDEKKLSKWNTDLDVLLIFVSLIPGGRLGPRSN